MKRFFLIIVCLLGFISCFPTFLRAEDYFLTVVGNGLLSLNQADYGQSFPYGPGPNSNVTVTGGTVYLSANFACKSLTLIDCVFLDNGNRLEANTVVVNSPGQTCILPNGVLGEVVAQNGDVIIPTTAVVRTIHASAGVKVAVGDRPLFIDNMPYYCDIPGCLTLCSLERKRKAESLSIKTQLLYLDENAVLCPSLDDDVINYNDIEAITFEEFANSPIKKNLLILSDSSSLPFSQQYCVALEDRKYGDAFLCRYRGEVCLFFKTLINTYQRPIKIILPYTSVPAVASVSSGPFGGGGLAGSKIPLNPSSNYEIIFAGDDVEYDEEYTPKVVFEKALDVGPAPFLGHGAVDLRNVVGSTFSDVAFQNFRHSGAYVYLNMNEIETVCATAQYYPLVIIDRAIAANLNKTFLSRSAGIWVLPRTQIAFDSDFEFVSDAMIHLQDGATVIATNNSTVSVRNTSPDAIRIIGSGSGRITGNLRRYVTKDSVYFFPVYSNPIELTPSFDGYITAYNGDFFNDIPVGLRKNRQVWKFQTNEEAVGSDVKVSLSGENPSVLCDVFSFDAEMHQWLYPEKSSRFNNLRLSSPAVSFPVLSEVSYYTYDVITENNTTLSVWNGSESSEWSNSRNWSTPPGKNSYVMIPSADSIRFSPVISGTAVCQRISLSDRASLTLDGGSLTVQTEIIDRVPRVDSPSFVIRNSFTNMSAFKGNCIDRLLRPAPVKVERDFIGPRTYYVSSAFFSGANSFVAEKNGYSSMAYYLQQYDKNNDRYVRVVNPTKEIGCCISFTESGVYTVTEVGVLQPYQEKSFVLDSVGSGWNMVANPYSFAIPLKFADKAFSYNEDLAPGMWFREYEGGAFCWKTYSFAGKVFVGGSSNSNESGQDFIITPYQTFFLRAIGVAPQFSIDPSVVTAIPSNVGEKSLDCRNDLLRLFLSSDSTDGDETALVFNENGSLLANKNDIGKKTQDEYYNNIFVYKDSKAFAISIFPQIGLLGDEIEIPIGFRLKGKKGGALVDAEISSSTAADFDSRYFVFLRDSKTGEEINLRRDSYSFTDKPGVTNVSRFAIILRRDPEASVLTRSCEVLIKETVISTVGNRKVVVEADPAVVAAEAFASVYDLNGRLVARRRLSDVKTTISLGNCSGLYVVKADSDSGVVSKKVNVR